MLRYTLLRILGAIPTLLLVIALRGPVPARRAFVSMALGFGLAVLAYSFPETKGGTLERVVPFAVALAVAWFLQHCPLKESDPRERAREGLAKAGLPVPG